MRDLLKKLKPSPAPKRAVLLPDHCFFGRVLPVSPAAAPEEIAGQVALALDGLSPFPVAQLCYGYFHVPGAVRALVFASYRRRFTVNDAAAWEGADAVMPAFAACLETGRTERRALLITGADYVTAMGWDGRDAVPAVIATRQVAPDAPPEERAAARTELAERLKEFPPPVEVAAPAGTTSIMGDKGLVFPVGDGVTRFDSAQIDALDVRDKDRLASRRKLRARDLYLWRAFVGCAAALALAGALELGLTGMRFWEKRRAAVADRQSPVVQEIETKNTLANRIEDLSAHRLMPIRMIEIVNEKRPRSVLFTRVVAKDLYTLQIDGKTNVPPDVASYETALRELPGLESVESGSPTQVRGGTATFSLTLKFKPEALPSAPPLS